MYFFIPDNSEKIICFIHNKKTGGTSVHDTFKCSKLGVLYPNKANPIMSQKDEDKFKSILTGFNGCFDYKGRRYDRKNFPAGHITFKQAVLYLLKFNVTPEEIRNKIVFCTIVRNPFDRLKSWWFHLKYKGLLQKTEFHNKINQRFIELCYSKFDRMKAWKRVVNSLKCQHDYYKDCKVNYNSQMINFAFEKQNILRTESLQNDFDKFMIRNFNLKLEPLGIVNSRKSLQCLSILNGQKLNISFEQAKDDIRCFEHKVIEDFNY